MTRTYELGLVIEPRQSDETVLEIVAKYREMIAASGGTVTEEDNWGRRKLAYPIRKFNEAKYVFLFVASEGSVTWTDIERNLMQNEAILRYLVVRTDLDLKRAATKAKRRKKPAQTEESEP